MSLSVLPPPPLKTVLCYPSSLRAVSNTSQRLLSANLTSDRWQPKIVHSYKISSTKDFLLLQEAAALQSRVFSGIAETTVQRELIHTAAFKRGRIIVSHDSDHKIVGCAEIVPLPPYESLYPSEQNPVAFLKGLCVDKMHQNRGLGKQMVQQCLNKARQSGFEYLLLSAQGSLAQFYEKQQFKRVHGEDGFKLDGLPDTLVNFAKNTGQIETMPKNCHYLWIALFNNPLEKYIYKITVPARNLMDCIETAKNLLGQD